MINQTQFIRPEQCDQGQSMGASDLVCEIPEFSPLLYSGGSHLMRMAKLSDE